MKILVCLVLGLAICGCDERSHSIKADAKTYGVKYGKLGYRIDPLNRICTVGQPWSMQHMQPLPQPMCDRLIERYVENR